MIEDEILQLARLVAELADPYRHNKELVRRIKMAYWNTHEHETGVRLEDFSKLVDEALMKQAIRRVSKNSSAKVRRSIKKLSKKDKNE